MMVKERKNKGTDDYYDVNLKCHLFDLVQDMSLWKRPVNFVTINYRHEMLPITHG